MAKQFPDPADLEQTAQYRPGIGSNILNLLTGGIYGGLSGQTQRAQEAATARQLLLQQRMQDMGLDRALFRQKMGEALKAGAALPEGISRMDRDQAGALLDEAIRKSRIDRLKQELQGITGEPVIGDVSEGELEGRLQRIRTTLSAETGRKLRGEEAKGLLTSLQGRGAFPSPMNVSKMTPEQAIAEAEIAGQAYKQATEIGAMDRQKKREDEAIKDWRNEINAAEPNEEKLSSIFNNLPRDFQKDPAIRSQVGLQNTLSPQDRKNIKLQREAYGTGVDLIKSMSKLVGSRDYNEVSQLNFNQLSDWKRTQGQKLFTQSPEWAAIDDILQQAEQYKAGQRKDLFGASLTGNELESANRLFANPGTTGFIPNLLRILDRQFQKDFIAEEYTANNIFVPPAQRELFDKKRQEYLKIRPLLQSVTLGDVQPGQQPMTAPAPAAGATNRIRFDTSGNIIK